MDMLSTTQRLHNTKLVFDNMIDEVYELIVIGAGPHALSLLSRLLCEVPDKYEERPSNTQLFSRKSEKFHSKVKDNPQTQRTPRQIASYLHSTVSRNSKFLDSICVIDKYGEWMAQWAKQFDVLSISHLRSTTSVHPDAFDLHSLLAFAADRKRESELTEIDRNLRGAAFSGPFVVPSVALFWDFCEFVVRRNRLGSVVRRDTVVRVERGVDREQVVVLASGVRLRARHVVLALGNTSVKRIPDWAVDVYECGAGNIVVHTSDMIGRSALGGVNSKRSAKSVRFGLSPTTTSDKASDLKLSEATSTYELSVEDQQVLIVGGGLSSGHLAIKAALLGARKVYLLCRSELKVRQFDLELGWIGRSRFTKLAQFYSISDLQKRAEVIRNERGGGSVTPSVHEQVMLLQDEGKVQLLEQTEVWSCNLAPGEDGEKYEVHTSDGSQLLVNHIWLATGSVLDASKEPLLGQLVSSHGLPLVGGFPDLTEDLEWGDEGVYVMGAYAGLQLGPDALNLAGARGGASRVAHKLKKVFDKR